MKTFAFPAATVAAAIAVGAAIVVDTRALLLVPLAAVVVCVLRSAAGAAFAAAAVVIYVPVTTGGRLIYEATAVAIALSVYATFRLPGALAGSRRLFVLLAVPALSLLVKHDPRMTLRTERPFLTIIAVAIPIIAIARAQPDVARRWAVRLLWPTVPLAALALYELDAHRWPYIDSHATSASYTSVAYAGRAAATFGQPVVYGMVAAAAVVLAVTIRPRWWQLIAAANVCGALASGARSSWIVIGAFALFSSRAALRQIRMPRSTGAVSGAVLATASLIVAVAFVPSLTRHLGQVVHLRLHDHAAATSTQARENRQTFGLRRIFDSPVNALVGHGPQSAAALFYGFDGGDRGAATFDDTYLTIGYEDGLFGLVILAWLFAPLLRARGRAGAATAAVVGLSLLFFDFQNWPAAQGLLALGLGLAALPNHATAKVVTVPDDPLYVSAPATT